MAWIESHQELRNHPKLLHLASLLRCSKAAAIGHLHCLWWWSVDYAESGNLAGFKEATIANAAEWRGNAEKFVEALFEAEWLDSDYSIHNWDLYTGRLLSRRAANRTRMREARAAHGAHTDETRAGATVQNSTEPTVQTEQTLQDRTNFKPLADSLSANGEMNDIAWLEANGLNATQNHFLAKIVKDRSDVKGWAQAVNKAKQRHPSAVVTTALSHLAEYLTAGTAFGPLNAFAALEAVCQQVEAREIPA